MRERVQGSPIAKGILLSPRLEHGGWHGHGRYHYWVGTPQSTGPIKHPKIMKETRRIERTVKAMWDGVGESMTSWD